MVVGGDERRGGGPNKRRMLVEETRVFWGLLVPSSMFTPSSPSDLHGSAGIRDFLHICNKSKSSTLTMAPDVIRMHRGAEQLTRAASGSLIPPHRDASTEMADMTQQQGGEVIYAPFD